MSTDVEGLGIYSTAKRINRGHVTRYTIKLTLTGPLFPIGIEHLIYTIFSCYGSSNGY